MRNYLIKEDVDEAIYYNKEYFSGCHGALELMSDAERKAFGDDEAWVDDIITGITCSQTDKNPPNELYYKVLDALDFFIVERAKVFDLVEKEKGGKE